MNQKLYEICVGTPSPATYAFPDALGRQLPHAIVIASIMDEATLTSLTTYLRALRASHVAENSTTDQP